MPVKLVETPQDQLAKMLTHRRKTLNIKQEDLAELSGVALRTIRDLEKGKGNPSLSTLRQLMHTLGFDLFFRIKR